MEKLRAGSAGMPGEMPVETGAEAFIELLNVNNVDYIFLNPGTDTTPIQEAVAKFKAQGRRTPRIILCTHENVAMAAAHGYFAVTKRPQVVLVHVDVGTQNIGGALHNAQRARIGVVVCAGRTPSVFEGERAGGRNMGMMWWQEQRDQAGVVRNFTKWDYELRFTENAHHVVQRAFQVASAEPCGPVYLTLPREVLLEKVSKVQVLDTSRHSAPVTPQADLDALARVADILSQATNPLLIVGYSGRNPQSVGPLVELAETIGARVASFGTWMNFPTHHPLCLSGLAMTDHIKQADAILIIDHDIPYVPVNAKPGAGARIMHIDIDAVKKDMVMWGFPVDILIEADSAKALPVLNGFVSQRITSEQKSRARARLLELEKQRRQFDAESRSLALAAAGETPISLEWLCHCLSEVIDEDTIVVDEALGSGAGVWRYVPRTRPGTTFGSGGSSLGFGLGASLGIKLAAPDRTVACLVGDGSFIFGCPTTSLWASAVYRLPFLCVVFNNEGYDILRMNLRSIFGQGSFGARDPFAAGADIAPSPDYAMIARACGCYGEVLADPAEVKPALQRAMQQVRDGRTALLDVRIARR